MERSYDSKILKYSNFIPTARDQSAVKSFPKQEVVALTGKEQQRCLLGRVGTRGQEARGRGGFPLVPPTG